MSIRSAGPTAARLPPYQARRAHRPPSANGLIRQFSLLNPNTDPDILRGRHQARCRRAAAVRATYFDEFRVGHTLKISAPRNNFPLVGNAEHVILFAGGIGITPIWCMAQQLEAQNRPWKLYYSCQSRADMAFVETLEKFGPDRVHLHFDDEAAGKFLDLAGAIAAAPANAHFYCCGPNPMLEAFEAAAAAPAASTTCTSNISRPRPKPRRRAASGSNSRAPARNITSPRAGRFSKCSTKPASTSTIRANSASAASA